MMEPGVFMFGRDIDMSRVIPLSATSVPPAPRPTKVPPFLMNSSIEASPSNPNPPVMSGELTIFPKLGVPGVFS